MSKSFSLPFFCSSCRRESSRTNSENVLKPVSYTHLIADGGGEDDMHRLGKGHFHAIGCNHLAVREFPGNTPVQVVAQINRTER